MKTDDVVAMLATGATTGIGPAPTRRLVAAIGWGSAGAMLLMAFMLGVRQDLADAVWRPMFWIKLGYALSLAVGSVFALSRLARPGATLAGIGVSLAAPVLAMWALAALALTDANAAERTALVFGKTWRSCPLLIATLSVPTFVAMAWVTKALAPTRLRLCGAAMGLAAGGLAAVVYSLHCSEMAAPFIALWYLAGLLVPAALGMLSGPWLLRW
jgi:hypothetical protein